MLLRWRLDRIKRPQNHSMAASLHRCSMVRNTSFTLPAKVQIIGEKAIKNISFDWTVLVFSPSTFPASCALCLHSLEPLRKGLPTKQCSPAPGTKRLSSGLSLPIATANGGKEDENGIWTNTYCTYNCLLILGKSQHHPLLK